MKIAVLSGKGGTGKTFVSVNLAAASSKAVYVDCDVEEPNGHLFFKPQNLTTENVSVMKPIYDSNICKGCRKCVDFCKYNALAYVGGKIKVFDDVCHSCGGCVILCPQKAMSDGEKIIGKIETGFSENVRVMTGILNTGEASGVPIIRKILNEIYEDITIIDSPPGSACVVMESIKDADYCILVAEPTIFGMHNLNMVHELVKLFNKPYAVVLNKCINEENPSEVYCTKHNIPIIAKIPLTNELATLNSNALIAVREKQEYKDLFLNLLMKVCKEVQS